MQCTQFCCSLAISCLFLHLQTSSAIGTSNYTTEFVTYLPGALSGWYGMTNGFISSVLTSAEQTVDLVIDLINTKDFQVPGSLYPLLKAQAAVIVCIVVGVLFIIIMWITGIMFCCSRCFGKSISYTNRLNTFGPHFQDFMLILFLAGLIIMLLPACIILFVINDSLTESFIKTEKTVVSSIRDVELFLNNTHDEVRSTVVNGVNEAVEKIKGNFDNLKNIAAEKMEKPLSNIGASVNQAEKVLIGWTNIFDSLEASYSSANEIKSGSKRIKDLLKNLKAKLTDLKRKCKDTSCQSIDPSEFDASRIPDLDISPIKSAKEKLGKLSKQDLNNMFQKIKSTLQKIPDVIDTNTKNAQKEAKKNLTQFANTALDSQFLEKLDLFTTMTRDAIELGHTVAIKAIKSAKPFDETRWKIGLTVSLLVLVVLLGVSLGLTIGTVGSYFPLLPGDYLRFGGGYILISIVYWIFLVSTILMGITTFLFVTGGIIEMYICRPLFDEKFIVIDNVVKAIRDQIKTKQEGIEYKVTRNLTPSFILSSCESNKTAYVALNLEHLDLKSMLNYKKAIDIEKHLKGFASSIPAPTLNLPSSTSKEFTDLKKALDFTIPKDIFKMLDKTLPNFEKTHKLLLSVSGSDDAVNDVTEIEDSLKHLDAKMKNLKKTLKEGMKKARETKEALQNLMDGINNLTTNSQRLMPNIINEVIDSLSQNIQANADELMNDILNSLKTDIAHCKLAWDIFNSARTILCKYYVLPMNGIWFGIGWSLFFFIPMICVCTRLSDNFRTDESKMEH